MYSFDLGPVKVWIFGTDYGWSCQLLLVNASTGHKELGPESDTMVQQPLVNSGLEWLHVFDTKTIQQDVSRDMIPDVNNTIREWPLQSIERVSTQIVL